MFEKPSWRTLRIKVTIALQTYAGQQLILFHQTPSTMQSSLAKPVAMLDMLGIFWIGSLESSLAASVRSQTVIVVAQTSFSKPSISNVFKTS